MCPAYTYSDCAHDLQQNMCNTIFISFSLFYVLSVCTKAYSVKLGLQR